MVMKSLPLLLCALLAAAPALLAQDPEPRTLVFAFDAVPFDVIQRLTDPALGEAALFRDLGRPVELISTFPSTTSLAFSGILEPFGLEKSPGYEVRYYDRARNRIHGGGLVSYNKYPFPWRTFFDYKRNGLWGKLTEALKPVKRSREAIDEALEAFFQSDKKVFFAYTDATDLVGHMKTPPALDPVFVYLDAELREMKARHPDQPFRTVLYSDHGQAGGEPLFNVRRGVRKALKRGGYRLRRGLHRQDNVVIVPFGLVSSFVAFTRDDQALPVAEAMASAKGVDLCALPHDGGWQVLGGRGRAQIRRRESDGDTLWSYDALAGDPLLYLPIVERLESDGHGQRADGLVWFRDQEWFEATDRAEYADALYRISRAFDLAENPASIACSVDIDSMYGAASTVFGSRLSLGRLRWTHGALLAWPSYGFLLSDVPELEHERPVRFDQALAPLAPARREEARQQADP